MIPESWSGTCRDIDMSSRVKCRVEVTILGGEHQTMLGDVEVIFPAKWVDGTLKLGALQSIFQL